MADKPNVPLPPVIQIPKPSNFAKAQKFQVPKGRDYAGFRRGSR
jgi:hypothetical protein